MDVGFSTGPSQCDEEDGTVSLGFVASRLPPLARSFECSLTFFASPDLAVRRDGGDVRV